MKFCIFENERKKNQIAKFIYETTYLLILHVNEGNEWPGNPVFRPSDLLPKLLRIHRRPGVKPVRVLQLERPFDPSKTVAK